MCRIRKIKLKVLQYCLSRSHHGRQKYVVYMTKGVFTNKYWYIIWQFISVTQKLDIEKVSRRDEHSVILKQ